MEENAIRQQLAEATRRLAEIEHERIRLEQERKAMTGLVEGFTGWLQIYGDHPVSEPARPAHRFESKGTLSMKAGVLAVLQNIRPESMHLRDILQHAIADGVQTNAKDPLTVAENHLLALIKEGKAERTGPRTFRATDA